VHGHGTGLGEQCKDYGFGYSLRKLEMELQPHTGVGYGLVGIFEIRK